MLLSSCKLLCQCQVCVADTTALIYVSLFSLLHWCISVLQTSISQPSLLVHLCFCAFFLLMLQTLVKFGAIHEILLWCFGISCGLSLMKTHDFVQSGPPNSMKKAAADVTASALPPSHPPSCFLSPAYAPPPLSPTPNPPHHSLLPNSCLHFFPLSPSLLCLPWRGLLEGSLGSKD